MNDLERKKMKDQLDMRTRYLAKYCHEHRNEFCPHPEVSERGVKAKITWGQLFKKRTGQSLEGYLQEGAL